MTGETSQSGPGGSPSDRRSKRRGLVGGIVLVVLGCLLLLERFVPEIRLEDYWPLILIAIGAAMLLNRRSS